MSSGNRGFVSILQEFSIPLIAGVLCAVAAANLDGESYHEFIEYGPLDAMCADKEPGFFCQPAHGHGHGDAHADDGHGDAHADDAHGDDAHAAGDDHGHAEGDDHAEALANAHGGEAADPSALGDIPPADAHEDDHGTISNVFGIFGHHFTLHFIINDIFMLFFFGIAAKEITESVLPGGDLNPPSKAINPLFGTIGGVVGPVGVYFLLSTVFYGSADPATKAAVFNGWGIPTATDIALAWLVARVVFGGTHPAVNFLLLLAIADDAIGLGIIAIFYPNPDHPPAPIWLLLVLVAMAGCYGLRRAKVGSWVPYIMVFGFVSWIGLLLASLHPALALVPLVPFLPGPERDTGLFNPDEFDAEASATGHASADADHSPLHNFEHHMKLPVDFGLFFFGLMNAGVAFDSINAVTWIVLASLIAGKMIGITALSSLANAIGFKYPDGMSIRHIVVAACVAGLGLTVALFVAGEAFPGDSPFQGPAKMGALASAFAGVLAYILGRALKVKELDKA